LLFDDALSLFFYQADLDFFFFLRIDYSSIRLLWHVYFSIEWPCLYICEWDSDNNNMNDQLDEVCFIRLCLLFFLSLSIVHSNLYFTLYSYSKSIHIYILTNDRGDLKGYSPAVFYSLDLRYWYLIRSLSQISGTCLNTYENNYKRNKAKNSFCHSIIVDCLLFTTFLYQLTAYKMKYSR